MFLWLLGVLWLAGIYSNKTGLAGWDGQIRECRRMSVKVRLKSNTRLKKSCKSLRGKGEGILIIPLSYSAQQEKTVCPIQSEVLQ